MLPICAEPAVLLTVSDRTEHRVRISDSGRAATDLATVPTVAFGLHARRYDGWLSTYPLFAVHDLQSSPPPSGALGGLVLAQGSTGFAWRSRRLQIVASESGSYGLQNFAYLMPLNLPPGQVAPPTTPIPTQTGDFLFASSQSLMSATYRWSRQWSTFVSPVLTVGGGIDDKQKPLESPTQYVPFQIQPRLDLRLDYRLSSVSRLETRASGLAASFDPRRCDYRTGGSPSATTATMNTFGVCDSDGQVVEWAETWRRQLSRGSEIGLGAGGSILRTRIDAVNESGAMVPSPIPERTRFFPVATAYYARRFSIHRPEQSRLEVDVRLGPMVDIRFGWIDPRLSVAVRDITRYKKTEFRAALEFAQSIPSGGGPVATFFQGTLEALYPLGKRLAVGGGIRSAFQRQTGANGEVFPFFSTTILYGTVAFTEPTIHLLR